MMTSQARGITSLLVHHAIPCHQYTLEIIAEKYCITVGETPEEVGRLKYPKDDLLFVEDSSPHSSKFLLKGQVKVGHFSI